ncbi:MAG: hypothetical protein AB7U44_02450 [Sulfuricurvum sp.]
MKQSTAVGSAQHHTQT